MKQGKPFLLCLCCLCANFWVCEDPGSAAPPPPIPVANAGRDTIVAPDSQIVLSAAACVAPEAIVRYEWSLGSSDSFFVVSSGDTIVTAPSRLTQAFPCVLRVTSLAGATSLDTMTVTVSWLKAPNGGEHYLVGDSLHIDFFPVDVLIGLKLVIVRDGEDFLLNIPGVNSALLPIANPRVSFVIPPTIYDLAYGGEVSTVSDTCRILVHRYTDYGENIRSARSFSISDRSQPASNRPPLAIASGDTVACPDSLFTLHAEASDPDSGAVLMQWSIGGGPFTPVSTADTSVLAPSAFNKDYPCILRVTDDSGAVALDTHHVIVSWIRSPNGGESFTAGDTLRVHLFAVRELVGLKLMIYRGDEMDLSVAGSTGSFSPANEPWMRFAIPDTIHDDFFGPVSTVSDSCKIRVFLYMGSETYVQSAGFFRILPRP